MDEMERKFTVDLIEAALQEEGYHVANHWDNFGDADCSALRVFPRRGEDDRPTLYRSFMVKITFQREEVE